GPVPVGVPGELYIGGVGLARGYLGRAGLTAERFVPDPFARTPGARLYRTGDRVRHAVDGTLEFLGRLDHQVKLRGFRIEPGEIEALLLQQPGVRDAVVVLREDVPGDRRLVGYVVADAAQVLPEALLQALGARLPEYMVPTAVVVLEAFVLTPNGKLDRKALPVPALRRTGEQALPATPTEELLAGVYGRLLGVELVLRDDHFFQLGGHSLLATQLVSRVREVFAVELPLRAVFESPTVSGLAQRIDQGQRGVEDAIALVDREGRLPLSYAQERLWFLDRLDPGKATYNVPVALRLEGELDESALAWALGQVIARHEILRSRIRSGSDGPELEIDAWPDWQLQVETLAGTPEEREAGAREIARAQALAPFDLAQGPLLRVQLVRVSEGDALLLLIFHHIVSDGWSLNVLLSEVSQLYADARAGRESTLPALPIQYADYAAWQRRYLAAGAEARQLGYWKQQLSQAPGVLGLPLDRPRPPVQAFRGAVVGTALPQETLGALERLGREHGATLYMLLLAALQALLSRHAGQEDLLVGSPIAGRAVRATEPLIGFFVNTLVLRGRPQSEKTFAQFLQEVRETALEAYAHQDVPFERLVEEVHPERNLSHTPLFQVMFALQRAAELPGGGGQGLGEDGGLRLRPMGVESTIAKFDQSWTAVVDGEGLRLVVEYDRDLFDALTVERMLEQYVRVLAQVVADAQVTLGGLSLLEDAERRQVLEDW
ncbi:MAG: condensation domain-containing protein, partial [Gemmatimonadota bacterium]|nr:condensation domain-containing protein [Gemmatimonadota bacterium]